MKFSQYVKLREGAVDINSVRGMILRAVGGNPDSQDAHDAPLSQFAEPGQLADQLNSLKGLADLINNCPPALSAIQAATDGSVDLTVGQLAALLVNQK